MIATAFSTHAGLLTATRLPALGRAEARISSAEVATLLLAGAAAAVATGFIRLGLRIPGHAIVLAVLPMAFGFALVPRRFAGLIMSGGAFGTAGALSAAGAAHYGVGAMTSLCLTGAMMDVALLGAGAGWPLYARLVGAGVASNMVAFMQRGASKLLAFDQPGTRLFDGWASEAMITYTLSGMVAGLLGALCWFQFRSQPASPDGERVR
jgi:hypothetical protein